MAIARCASRSAKRSARAISDASCMSTAGYVEVAVADMADDRRDQALVAMSRCVSSTAIGETRDRHADVGGERRAPGLSAVAAQ